MSLRAQFLRFDGALAAKGVKPLTAWWREGIGAWLDAYEAGHVLELWACVGRGAAKSTALYKLCAFFALFGDFDVPPGERHFAVVLSRLKEEATKGLAIIGSWLRLLGVPHKTAGDVIELEELPRGIRVVAASVAATSGWRAFFIGKDERSKWAAGGEESLDAEEVDTSAGAMTATHALAPTVAVGSAWGAFGAFFDAINGGTTEARVVLGPTPTWIAAPHITEESTRRKERDPRKHAREYGAVFQASASSVFDLSDIDAAIAHPRHANGLRMRMHGVIDAASGGKDAFTFGGVRWVLPPNGAEWRPFLELAFADEVPASVMREKGAGAVMGAIISAFRKHGIKDVHGDQRDAPHISAAFDDAGLGFRQHPWTSASKPPAVERLRGWVLERAIALPAEPTKLRAELLQFEERLSPSGQYTYAGRGGAHDDYVALLITTAMANVEGRLVHEDPDATMHVFPRGRFATPAADPYLLSLRRQRYSNAR